MRLNGTTHDMFILRDLINRRQYVKYCLDLFRLRGNQERSCRFCRVQVRGPTEKPKFLKLQRLLFVSPSSRSRIGQSDLLEMLTDHGGQRRISLGSNPPHPFYQIVVEGKGYI